jgi:hypothetical protein
MYKLSTVNSPRIENRGSSTDLLYRQEIQILRLTNLLIVVIYDIRGENMIFKKHVKENVGMVDTIEVIVNKKRGNANIEIKHDGNGKETMTITCKDEYGKEIKIEIPWETIQRLRK